VSADAARTGTRAKRRLVKTGADKQQPWLVVNNDRHPFADEQFIAVAVSRYRYESSIALSEEVRETGGVPESSFVAPWSVHSPRIEDVTVWQGRMTETFVDRVVDEQQSYVR